MGQNRRRREAGDPPWCGEGEVGGAGVDMDRCYADFGDRARGFDRIEGAVLEAAAVAGGQHYPDLCIAAEIGGVRRPAPPHRLPIALARRVERPRDHRSFQPHATFTLRIERAGVDKARSEEHTSELQSLMRISYAVFCLKKKTQQRKHTHQPATTELT